MKVPLIWLKDYIKINKNPREIAESFTYLGLMLDKIIDDKVLDLEHRMDRSDWLSITGCARDLAAFEGKEFINPSIEHPDGKPMNEESRIDVKIQCPELVNRFNTRVFKGIKVSDSPQWLKERLELYGIPSINNIVDITNFVMVEMGQPMHAQDIDKMQKKEIVIRRAKEGEEITTLLGQKLSLNNNQFVLTQNNVPTVLGGIVGTHLTSVDLNTKNIVLDAGNYDQVSIRKNSRELKIQNETVLRYDKYLHPHLAETAMERATKLILEIAGGEYFNNIDYYPKIIPLKKLSLRYSRIKMVSGIEIGQSRVEMILRTLGYKILNTTDKDISLEVPYFRTDVEVEDDLVADILRIGNYSNIPSTPIHNAPPKEITPPIYKFQEKLRDILLNLGMNEHITNPLLPKNNNDIKQIALENSFSSDRSALRTNIKDTLESVIDVYRKNKVKDIGIFEVGNIYTKEKEIKNIDSLKETSVLTAIYDNTELNEYEISNKLKSILSGIFSSLDIKDYVYVNEGKNTVIYVNNNMDKERVGEIEYNSFSLHLEKLMDMANYPRVSHICTRIISKRTEDISLIVKLRQEIGPIYQLIKNYDKNILEVEVREVTIDENIKKDAKLILIKIYYEGEFKEVKERMLAELKDKFNIEVRS